MQTAEAAASLVCEAKPTKTGKEGGYGTWSKNGFERGRNKYEFWLTVFLNAQIDGCYYGTIDKTGHWITSRPYDHVIPVRFEGRRYYEVDLHRVADRADGTKQYNSPAVPEAEMLIIPRPNTRIYYDLDYTGPIWNADQKPRPTYKDLSNLIFTGVLIDRFMRGF